MTYDIITTGSATIDVFANTHSPVVKFHTEEGEKEFITYPSGSKILVKDIDFLVGGGGTNTAVSFARLGLKTAYLGKIGSDANASQVLDLLSEEGIDFVGVQDGQTGFSIVLDSIEHDRSILAFKGANDQLGFDELDTEKIRAKWLYSSSLTGKSFETLKEIVNLCKGRKIKVAFNPSNYQATLGYDALYDVISKCDALVMNLEEAELLFTHSNGSFCFDEYLLEHKETYVLITNAGEGALCYYNGNIFKAIPSKDHPVVETTGAGDSFASAFVAGLAYGYQLPDALTLALVQANSVIGSVGAKTGLLELERAKELMKSFTGQVLLDNNFSFFKNKGSSYVCSDEKAFKFQNGKTITSLANLAIYLQDMPDDIFNHHVNGFENHFADWVKHVFGSGELSSKMRLAKDKKTLADTIILFIQKG